MKLSNNALKPSENAYYLARERNVRIDLERWKTTIEWKEKCKNRNEKNERKKKWFTFSICTKEFNCNVTALHLNNKMLHYMFHLELDHLMRSLFIRCAIYVCVCEYVYVSFCFRYTITFRWVEWNERKEEFKWWLYVMCFA